MILLALDTSGAVATAALFQNGVLLGEREADASKKHAETALPLIDELLRELQRTVREVDVFAVDVGPGSFTGVRIGVSLVNALAFALQKPVVAVDSLAALAADIRDREDTVCALVDARNGNAYAAVYRAGETLAAPKAVALQSFLETLPTGVKFVGELCADVKTSPCASGVGKNALRRLDEAKSEVEPVYLRASQAERLRKRGGEG